MNALVSFAAPKGRIARKPFALGVLALYVAGIAAQALLLGDVISRFGLWPFVAVQMALIWAWLVLHIRRLRDAGEGPAAAIGIALICILLLGLLLMLVVFFTNPAAGRRPVGENPPGDAPPPT